MYCFFSAFYFKVEAGGCIGVSMSLSVFLGRVVSGSWYVFLKIKNKESEIYQSLSVYDYCEQSANLR